MDNKKDKNEKQSTSKGKKEENLKGNVWRNNGPAKNDESSESSENY